MSPPGYLIYGKIELVKDLKGALSDFSKLDSSSLHAIKPDFLLCLAESLEDAKELIDEELRHSTIPLLVYINKPFDTDFLTLYELGVNRILYYGIDFELIRSDILQAISQHKSSEKYRRLYHRFKWALESTDIGLYDYYDVPNEKIWQSPSYCEILGYKPEECKMSLEFLRSIVHPEEEEILKETILGTSSGNEKFALECRLRRKSGEYNWYAVTGQTLWNDKNELIRLAGTLTNVQKRKQSEYQFEELMTKLPTPTFIITGREIVFFNKAAKEVLQIDERVKHPKLDQFIDLTETELHLLLRQMMHDEKKIIHFPLRVLTGYQEYLHTEITLTRIEYKKSTALLGTIFDLTEREKSSRALKKSESTLRLVQQQAKIGPWEKNLNNGEYNFSGMFYQITELSPGEGMAELLELVPEGERDELQNGLRQAESSTQPVNLEFRIKHPGSPHKFILLKAGLNDELNLLTGSVMDISSIKYAELEVRRQKNFTESILNSIPVEIAVFDKDFRYQFINKQAVKRAEMREWLVGKTDEDYFNRKGMDQSKARQRIEAMRKARKLRKEISWIEKVSGEPARYISRRIYPVFQNDALEYYIGYGTDLTQQISAEEKLRFRVEFERIIIGMSSRLINADVHNMDVEIHSGLKAIGEIAGVDRAYVFHISSDQGRMSNTHEWVRKGIEPMINQLQNIPVEELPWWNNKMQEGKAVVLDDVTDLPPEAYREKAEFEKQKIKSLVGVPIKKGNRLEGFIGFDAVREKRQWGNDITDLLRIAAQTISNARERLISQTALMDSEEKFRSLAEHAHAAIFITSDLRFVYANPETTELTGYDFDELLTLNLLDLFDKEERNSAGNNAEKILSNKAYDFRNERKIITRNGETKYIDITSNKIVYNRKNAIISIAFDITAKKKGEQETTSLIEQLTQQNQDLEQFSYITSHNLRSPVAGIKGLISILDHNKLGSDFNKDVFERLSNSSEKLDNVIKELNEIISLKKTFSEGRTSINLKELTNEIVAAHQEFLNSKDADISTSFEVEEVMSVKGYLNSILTNLITNAAKYRHPDRPAKIHLRSYLKDNLLVIEVKDNGLGIDLNRFGEKLFKFKQRFHLEIEGNGLGLYLVKTQTKALGGTVEVKSEPNKGAVFRVNLPMH